MKPIRSSLACLACRKARHRCDGPFPSKLWSKRRSNNSSSSTVLLSKDDDVVCKRCSSQNLQCEWAASKRGGRRERGVHVTNHTNDNAIVASPTMELVVEEGTASLSEDLGDDKIWQELLKPWAPLTFPSVYLDHNLSNGSQNSTLDKNDFLDGIRIFFQYWPDPIPNCIDWEQVLLDEGTLSNSISNNINQCLLLSASCTGLRYSRTKQLASEVAYEKSKEMFFQECQNILSTSSTSFEKFSSIIILLQAASILVQYSYGMYNLNDVFTLFVHCRNLVMNIGLNRIDDKDVETVPIRDFIVSMPRTKCTSNTKKNYDDWHSCPSCFTNLCRQAWWDLYYKSCVIYAASRIGGPDSGTIVAIDFNVRWPEQGGDILDRLYELRGRASFMLLQAVNPTPPQFAAQERLDAIKITAESIMYSLEKVLNKIDEAEGEDLFGAVQKRRALCIASKALTAVHASQVGMNKIFLHSSPSQVRIENSLENNTSQSTNGIDEILIQLAMIKNSIGEMDKNADKVITMIKANDEKLAKVDRFNEIKGLYQPCTPPNAIESCPFFACVQVAAVLGKEMVLTAHLTMPDCQSDKEMGTSCFCKKGSKQSNLLLWPKIFFKKENIPNNDDDYALAIQELIKWKRIKSLQIIQTSQDLLEDANVWPMTKMCKITIEKCKKSIQSIARGYDSDFLLGI